MNELISIIVPIYNTKMYLEKCIGSIINQSYEELEIILIDDGSTDGSGQICDFYAKIDDRIRVIHKDNEGLVSARKYGESLASGKFCLWVDSDDWIEKSYCADLIEAVRSNPDVDCIVTDLYFDIGNKSRIISNNFPEGIFLIKNIIDRLLMTETPFEYGIQPHGVTKLFIRDRLLTIHSHVDNSIRFGEDAAVVYPYLLASEKVYVSKICGYHYVQHPNSMTKTNKTSAVTGIKKLITLLSAEFKKSYTIDQYREQLFRYTTYLLALHAISTWDIDGETFLRPYGSIKRNYRIVIYGAGGLGQEIREYLSKQETRIVAWVDQNADYYKSLGMDVISIEELIAKNYEFDCVLIANISNTTAVSIRNNLLRKGICEAKIYWFCEDFLKGEFAHELINCL